MIYYIIAEHIVLIDHTITDPVIYLLLPYLRNCRNYYQLKSVSFFYVHIEIHLTVVVILIFIDKSLDEGGEIS